MNIHKIQWLIIIAYLTQISWAIDQEFPSPVGPGINFQGLSLAKGLSESSDQEENTNESSSSNADEGEIFNTNRLGTTTTQSIEGDLKDTAVTSNIIKDKPLNIKDHEEKAVINATDNTPICKCVEGNDLDISKETKELISRNDEPSMKILEKRETENRAVEGLGQNKSIEILSSENDINQKLNYFANDFRENQNVNVAKSTTGIQESIEQEDDEKARRFRGLFDDADNTNRIDKNLIPQPEPSGLFNKHSELANKPKSKCDPCEESKMESVIPEIHTGNFMPCERDEEETAKRLQGMLGVVDSVMAVVGMEMRKELGICKKSKISDVASIIGNDDEKIRRVTNMITSCVRDALKEQLTMKCCIPLPRELHSFLVWILHGSEGGKICPPTMHEQRCKPSYLFHEDNHRPHFSNGLLGTSNLGIVSSNKGRPGTGQQTAVAPAQEQMPPREKEISPKVSSQYDFDSNLPNNNQGNMFPPEPLSTIRDSKFQKKTPFSPNAYFRSVRSAPNTNYKTADSKSPKITDEKVELMTYSDGIDSLFSHDFEFQRPSSRILGLTEEEIHPASYLVEDNLEKKINKRELSRKRLGAKSRLLKENADGVKLYTRKKSEFIPTYLSEKLPLELFDDTSDPPDMIIDVDELLNPILEEDNKIFSKHKKERHKERKKNKLTIHKDPQTNEHIIKYGKVVQNQNCVNLANIDNIFKKDSILGEKETQFNAVPSMKTKTGNTQIKSSSAVSESDKCLQNSVGKDNPLTDANVTKSLDDKIKQDNLSTFFKDSKTKIKNHKNSKANLNVENVKHLDKDADKITTIEPLQMATTSMNLTDLIPQIDAQTISPKKIGKTFKKNFNKGTKLLIGNKGKKFLHQKSNKKNEKDKDRSTEDDSDEEDDQTFLDLGDYVPFDPKQTISEYYIRHIVENKKGGRKINDGDSSSSSLGRREKSKYRAKDRTTASRTFKGKAIEEDNKIIKKVTDGTVAKYSTTTTAPLIATDTTKSSALEFLEKSTNKVTTVNYKVPTTSKPSIILTSQLPSLSQKINPVKNSEKVNENVTMAALSATSVTETKTEVTTKPSVSVHEKSKSSFIKNNTFENPVKIASIAITQSKLNDTFLRNNINALKTNHMGIQSTTHEPEKLTTQNISISNMKEISKQSKQYNSTLDSHKEKSKSEKIKNETLDALEKLKNMDENSKGKKNVNHTNIANEQKRLNGVIGQAGVDDIISQIRKEIIKGDEVRDDETLNMKQCEEDDDNEEGTLSENDEDIEKDQNFMNAWRNDKYKDQESEDEEDEEDEDDDDLIIEGKGCSNLISKVVKMSDPKNCNIITQYQAPKLLDDENSLDIDNPASQHNNKKGRNMKHETMRSTAGANNVQDIGRNAEDLAIVSIQESSTSIPEEIGKEKKEEQSNEEDDEEESEEDGKLDLDKPE